VEIKERSLGWKKGRLDLAKEKREREGFEVVLQTLNF
jgi:hypothetical protein